MHLLSSSYNRIHRAGIDTECTSDTILLINQRYRLGLSHTIRSIQRYRIDPQQISQLLDTSLTARRALIDTCTACGNRLCIGHATRKSTLTALSLRQDGIYSLYQNISSHPTIKHFRVYIPPVQTRGPDQGRDKLDRYKSAPDLHPQLFSLLHRLRT